MWRGVKNTEVYSKEFTFPILFQTWTYVVGLWKETVLNKKLRWNTLKYYEQIMNYVTKFGKSSPVLKHLATKVKRGIVAMCCSRKNGLKRPGFSGERLTWIEIWRCVRFFFIFISDPNPHSALQFVGQSHVPSHALGSTSTQADEPSRSFHSTSVKTRLWQNV
jgi:hypothetical protein